MRCDGQLELRMSFYAILTSTEDERQGTARGDGKTERGISATHGIGPTCEVGARKHGSGASEMWGRRGQSKLLGADSRNVRMTSTPNVTPPSPSGPEPSFVVRKLGPFSLSLFIVVAAPFFLFFFRMEASNDRQHVE